MHHSPSTDVNNLCITFHAQLYILLFHFIQMYGIPSTVGTNTLQYGQLGAQPGGPAYAFRGHLMPGPQMVQYQRPNAGGTTTDNAPLMQLPYHSGTTFVEITSCVRVQSEVSFGVCFFIWCFHMQICLFPIQNKNNVHVSTDSRSCGV